MKFLFFKIFSLLLILNISNLFSQSKISGRVIDDNGVPLVATQIFNDNNQIVSVSNSKGTFILKSFGVYHFQKKGYQSKSIVLKNQQNFIIQLEINPQELNEIIINATHIPKKLKKATASINIITSEEIKRSNNIDFSPILNKVPGVFMQSGALNTNRITIRGIGSRNLFGTSKIRAYFKDIPLTNGSGETTIEDFELASISRFEIIKGAASSIYGAGLGGVIHLKPENSYLNKTNLQTELLIGSFGLSKQILNANFGSEKNSFRAVYSNTHSDGYRENNSYKRQTFTLNSNHFIGDKDELSFLISYVNLKAFIPSSVNENTFINKPKSAAFTWLASQGFEDTQRGIFGVSWNHNYTTKLKQITSVFSSFRINYEPRPFNILDENTIAYGIRSRFLGTQKLFKNNLSWTIGAEFFNDNYNYQTFENLYENFPSGTGSVQGNELSNFKEDRYYYNVFAEINYDFSEKTTATIGLNFNETGYKLNDQFTVSQNNPNQSGNFTFKPIFSPKLGLSHLFLDNFSAFLSISHGFSPISLNETLMPNGQINNSLKPETGWNYELGTRGSAFKNRLQFNVSIYRLSIENLLVSRRTAQGEFIGINAGETQHDGFEAEVKFNLLKTKKISLGSFTNFTLNNFIFKKFIDNDDNFSGNNLTGVPSSVFNTGVDFNSELGFYGNINYQFVGEIPITDANNIYSDDYSLVNLKIGYQRSLNKNLNLNFYFGVNNVFNEKYASQILINASSFGGNAPRYYYPGNPINYFTGINLNYNF